MRIGIIGAGMIGATMAKLWVDAGHHVMVSSRHPDGLQSLVKELGDRGSAGAPGDAVNYGDVVMLTVPLEAVPGLAHDLAQALKGKIVLYPGTRTSAATAPGGLSRAGRRPGSRDRRPSCEGQGLRAGHPSVQHRDERTPTPRVVWSVDKP